MTARASPNCSPLLREDSAGVDSLQVSLNLTRSGFADAKLQLFD
ncbi:hypothetical protein COLO4_12987 [Corchorus olitorius]|uniref:Uncharacterized protein n=1 Tax=Corchorus olitorius TaxID=93759 RepID=A0A1R3JYU3_9ROSI|nr:hypothetical protein COLO4_12987 [Corchorus olitorius]